MRFPVLLALSALVLSGCTGIPADAAGAGDFVTATVTVTDPATGEVLVEQTQIRFAMLSGNSGFGFGFERNLLGASTNETTSFQSEIGSETVTVLRDQSFSLINAIERNRLTGFEPLEVGAVYQSSGTNFTVVHLDDTMVDIKWLLEGTVDQEIPEVGIVLHAYTDADMRIQTLDPMVGTTFQIAPPSPFNPNTPLGLAPGSYVTLGATETQIEYGYAQTQYRHLLGRTIQFEVEVIEVQQGPATQQIPAEGNIGARNSPVVDGVADPKPDFGAYLDITAEPAEDSEEHADDGHAH